MEMGKGTVPIPHLETSSHGPGTFKRQSKVAVAISGGVDSLVAAWLLKMKGLDLVGVHFTTGYEPEGLDLKHLENQLEFPVHSVDFQKIFDKEVVQYFIDTYRNGKTPNPCLICNPKIKFGALLDTVKTLGADVLATGHYADVRMDENGNPQLFKGRDPIKDQSYFLALLNRAQLSRIHFPLARMTKAEVVALAKKEGLVPSEKKESQDICFIPNGSFADFIASKCDATFPPGEIVTGDLTVVGTHKGLHRYTVGQRRGLNCPGPAPYYVKTIDMKTNRLVVAFKEELHESELIVENINWISPPWETAPFPEKIVTKIRYSHRGAPSRLIPAEIPEKTETRRSDSADPECDPINPHGRPSTTINESLDMPLADNSFQINAHGLPPTTNNESLDISLAINSFQIKESKERLKWQRVRVRFNTPQLAVTPGQGAVFYDGDRVLGAGIIQ